MGGRLAADLAADLAATLPVIPAVVDGEDQAAEAEPPRPSRRPAGKASSASRPTA
ncbi:hypothetical protein [Nonomuraea dietziae]|uniref:Uncharacterized protein n=1 Tax=Nonomuraea dietziae TaxID=65515 RepID=A0A7W5V3I6_9ACTN|nr:hypothetical protein [Nonomuraea dietziae]MBB3725638.1 hypothetical protein [Nonomuraea dietziae]